MCLGNGDGTFSAASLNTVPATDGFRVAVQPLDFNNDGTQVNSVGELVVLPHMQSPLGAATRKTIGVCAMICMIRFLDPHAEHALHQVAC